MTDTQPTVTIALDAVCICGHTAQQHFEDVCITEITGCTCGDYLPIAAAAEELNRLRRLAAKAQQPNTATPASTAPLASGLPLVKGNCPACRMASLFLGTGGYPTCSNHNCPEPDAATTVLEQYAHEAHPPIHAWRVETRDPIADQWAPGSHFAHRPNAVERWETANRTAPLWNNGTPVERRIVRETTTYTVDTEPAEAQQPDTAPRPVQHAPGKAVLCPNCLTKGYAICMPDETLPPPQGPEYTPCECGHIEPEHEADMGVCLTCDCDAYRPTPPAPLRPSEDDCPGFPERCPNLRSVDPNPPQHYGGIRCGCNDPQESRGV